MNVRTRVSLIWTMAAVAAFVSALALLVYWVSGEFNDAWLGGTLAIYAGLMIAAILLAVIDRPEPRTIQGDAHGLNVTIREAQAQPELPEFRQQVVYRTRHGELLRTTYGTPGRRRSDYFAFVDGRGWSAAAMDEASDRLDVAPVRGDVVAEARTIVRRRALAAAPQLIVKAPPATVSSAKPVPKGVTA